VNAATKLLQTYALDRAVSGIGNSSTWPVSTEYAFKASSRLLGVIEAKELNELLWPVLSRHI
jgi:hypothetical protein